MHEKKSHEFPSFHHNRPQNQDIILDNCVNKTFFGDQYSEKHLENVKD